MKIRQITISNTKDLRNFVNRSDVSVKSAFEVAETFLNVGDVDHEENLSICIAIYLIGGNGEPDFRKDDIINWINDYDEDPYNCKGIFSFR